MSNDAILARQMAFRREQTDLGALSGHRLAAHRAGDESPSAPQLRRPLFADTKRSEAARQNRHQKIHANGNLPPPLVPPQGRGQMDESAMQKCIEELRRRRFVMFLCGVIATNLLSLPVGAITFKPKKTRKYCDHCVHTEKSGL